MKTLNVIVTWRAVDVLNTDTKTANDNRRVVRSIDRRIPAGVGIFRVRLMAIYQYGRRI